MSMNNCACGRQRKICAISIVAVMIAVAVGGGYAYSETKKSYRQVGFNDGVVAANVEVIKLIRAAGVGSEDCSLHASRKLVELARAKSDSIYMVKDAQGVSFCEYK